MALIGRSLLAEGFNSRRHEQSSTLPISVDVLCETVIANIHLTQAGEDCLCAVIEVGRDEFLPLFYQSLGFLACRIKVTILAKFSKNIGTFAVQQLPLVIIICAYFFLIFDISIRFPPALLCFSSIFLSGVFDFGGIKLFET